MALLESDLERVHLRHDQRRGVGRKDLIPPGEQRKAAKRMQETKAGESASVAVSCPERVVRGIVLARLANFLTEHAKTRPVIAERIATMLDGRPLPRVPYDGQVGPGEILTLAHVVGGLPRGDMEEAEPMAVINGSPCSAALAADVALHARNRAGNAARGSRYPSRRSARRSRPTTRHSRSSGATCTRPRRCRRSGAT